MAGCSWCRDAVLFEPCVHCHRPASRRPTVGERELMERMAEEKAERPKQIEARPGPNPLRELSALLEQLGKADLGALVDRVMLHEEQVGYCRAAIQMAVAEVPAEAGIEALGKALYYSVREQVGKVGAVLVTATGVATTLEEEADG